MWPSKGTGKASAPFPKELPTEWCFLFKEAKLICQALRDPQQGCSWDTGVPSALRPHAASFSLSPFLIEMLCQPACQPQIYV